MNLLDIVKTITNPDTKLDRTQQQQFIDAVGSYNDLGVYIYRDTDKLKSITENLQAIVTLTEKLALQRTDEWFDATTIKKDMKLMQGAVNDFEKTAKEIYGLQQRLESNFESVGQLLGKYFDIDEAQEEPAPVK